MIRFRFFPIVTLLPMIACTAVEPNAAETPETTTPENLEPTEEPLREQIFLDLDNDEDNLQAWLKTRGSLDPEQDVFFYWTGSIYLQQEAEPDASPVVDFPGPILEFEGFNVARFVPEGDGVRMISREMAVYKSTFGGILDCWSNSILDVENPAQVPVVHVANDPVNHTLYGADYDIWGDEVVFRTEIQLNTPSPLPIADYPDYSASNTYQSVELFNWYVSLQDLQDPNVQSAPVSISWSRQGQLLPWMKAGQSTDKLVYHTHGRKLLGGFEELPQHLKDYVLEHGPEYQTAPSLDLSPNMTSWRVFKKLVDSGEYTGECE